MDGLDLCGIYTHFHSAFCNKKATDLQMVSFRSVIRQLQEKGFDVGICHCCNSAGLLRFPNYAMDAVRVGSAILGRLSFKGSYNLKRVGTLEATVDELRWLPKGHTCGYGAGWRLVYYPKRDNIHLEKLNDFMFSGCPIVIVDKQTD